MKPHYQRSKDYLVTASIGNITRTMVWNDSELLPLDFPVGWTLGRVGDNICLFDQSLPDIKTIEKEARVTKKLTGAQRMMVVLPPAHKGHPKRSLGLTVVPLEPLKPPYMQTSPDAYDVPNVPRQLMMYHGIRYFLVKYRPVGQHLTTLAGGNPVFTYSRLPQGYSVTTHVQGVQFKFQGKKHVLPPGAPRVFTQNEFFTAVFIHGISWWRFRAVQTPESMPPIEKEDSEEELQDQRRFKIVSQVVLSLLFSVFILTTIFKKDEAPISVTTIKLTPPKVIPHKEIVEIPPPKPPEPPPVPVPVVEKVVEKEPPPKPIEPPKVVEKKPPKPEKVVEKKPLPPQPKKVAKKQPTPPAPAPVAAPAPKVAKVKPPVATPPPQVKASTPPATGVVAKKTEPPPPDQSAQLLKSLSFLSSGAKDPKKGGVEKYAKNTQQKDFMASPTLGGGSKDSKVLDSMSSANGDSSIKTRSSRDVSSEVGFGSQAGKALNSVQGKVSLNQIYSGGGDAGSFASEGSGIAISGPGDLSEAEIEKALQKYLSKFQFCYEKALISDNTLGGNLRLQWNIGTSGGVSEAKVILSQMKNEGLHSCVLGVLKQVHFPSPRGGAVTAKKTFSFKASSI
jgi:hypothetical protein